MKDLIEDIRKKEFQKVYLLCGEEPYLRQLYKKKLTEAVLPEGDTMNLSIYTGKNVDPKAVIDQAETMPFFADKRLILLEDTGFFKNASPELADYIKTMPDTTCMVFVEEEVDKRGKLYKAVKAAGRIVEFGRQDERSLMRWILSSVKKEGKQITESAMHLFLEKAGDDMGNIQMELEKLFCYTLDKNEIRPEDVEEICITRTENKIFDMIRAVAQKQQKKAMDLYYDLLALKEPPMRIPPAVILDFCHTGSISRSYLTFEGIRICFIEGFSVSRVDAIFVKVSLNSSRYKNLIDSGISEPLHAAGLFPPAIKGTYDTDGSR